MALEDTKHIRKRRHVNGMKLASIVQACIIFAGLIYSVFGELNLDNVSRNYGIYEISTVIDSKNILKAIESFLEIFNDLKLSKLDNKYFINLREKNKIFYLKETFSVKPELIIKNYSM